MTFLKQREAPEWAERNGGVCPSVHEGLVSKDGRAAL